MNTLFNDRRDAGRQLAARLAPDYANRPEIQILALPRGGVPVAYEVACALDVPLDVFIVRKLGTPQHKEYAIGAIASGGVTLLDQEAIHAMQVNQQTLRSVIAAEQEELSRREDRYRRHLPPPNIKGQIVIVVDDGLATGLTMRAAVASIKKSAPRSIVVAVPVASVQACDMLQPEIDKLICLATPTPFQAVGLWYRNFQQTDDQEVLDLLGLARQAQRTKMPTDSH